MHYTPLTVEGEHWTFEHLEPLSFPYTIVTGGGAVSLFVDVAFSCHCFTRKPVPGASLPGDEWVFRTDQEVRILDRQRYEQSRRLLPAVIHSFDARKILFASTENYITVEATDANGVAGYYQVFFTVLRKEGAKGRVALTVQSAYFVDYVHRRIQPASKRPVRFKLIVTAAYERRKLKPGR